MPSLSALYAQQAPFEDLAPNSPLLPTIPCRMANADLVSYLLLFLIPSGFAHFLIFLSLHKAPSQPVSPDGHFFPSGLSFTLLLPSPYF